MTWQDVALALGQLTLSLALIPMLLSRRSRPPPLATSLPTAAILSVFAGVFLTLSLWFAAGTALLGSLLWAVLAWRRFDRKDVVIQEEP